MMNAVTSKVLTAIRFIADRPMWSVVLVVVWVLAQHRMVQLMENDAPTVPDLHFGFSPSSLKALHEGWNVTNGCQHYIRAASVDLFPYMECYTLLMAAMLMLATRRRGWDERFSLLPLVTLLSDIGETVILQESCRRRTNVSSSSGAEMMMLSDTVIQAGALFNRAKWVSVAMIAPVILYAFVVPDTRRRKVKNKM
jgi:hypothetical protein